MKGRAEMIWAVVLAAGESKRMGESKVLLPFGEKTMIEEVLDRVTAAKVDGVLVVLGSNWEKIAAQIKEYRVKVSLNPHFHRGMLSSVVWGFQALPAKVKAALFVLADQPRIPVWVINRIIAAYRKESRGIVIPTFKGERGHPVLIDRKYRDEVKTLDLEVGLRGLVYGHPEDVREVEVRASAVLRDIDSRADYNREAKRIIRHEEDVVK
jgi:molybdenum cofactor cytidylyltransferase